MRQFGGLQKPVIPVCIELLLSIMFLTMHVKYWENVPSACRTENGGRRQSSLRYQFKKWRLWAMEGLRPYATFFCVANQMPGLHSLNIRK